MLTFKEFLKLDEVFQATDTSSVRLEKSGQAYIYKFEVRGSDFQVILTKKTSYLPSQTGWHKQPIENTFDILFGGPDDFNLTGKAGTDVFVIYQHLLLAIKKLFEIEHVNAVTFLPSQVKMLLPYERFYNTFLKPKGFVRVSGDLYVSRDFLRESGMSNTPGLFSSMVSAERKKRKSIAALKLRQKEEKKFEKVKADMIPYENNFVYLKNEDGTTAVAWLGPVAEANYFYAVYLTKEGSRNPVSEEFHDATKIVKDRIPSDREIRQFWRDYKSNPNFQTDLTTRIPEFRDAFLDYKNRNRAGGQF